jgi:hypothetical protein
MNLAPFEQPVEQRPADHLGDLVCQPVGMAGLRRARMLSPPMRPGLS